MVIIKRPSTDDDGYEWRLKGWKEKKQIRVNRERKGKCKKEEEKLTYDLNSPNLNNCERLTYVTRRDMSNFVTVDSITFNILCINEFDAIVIRNG